MISCYTSLLYLYKVQVLPIIVTYYVEELYARAAQQSTMTHGPILTLLCAGGHA